MQKGTKIVLAVLVLLCLVGIVGFWSMFKNANEVLQQARSDSVTAGNEVLALLCSSWDYEAIALRTAPEFIPQEDAQRQFDAWMERFGPLVGGSVSVEKFQVDSDRDEGPRLVAILTGLVEFEEGMAHVTITLTREPKNAWLLSAFDIRPAE